jgi:hypothetical protein
MDSKPGQFEGVRWACHGNGFGKYWTQERNNASCEIMTYADGVGYNIACPQVATVVVYVKIDSPQMDQYKLDFFFIHRRSDACLVQLHWFSTHNIGDISKG